MINLADAQHDPTPSLRHRHCIARRASQREARRALRDALGDVVRSTIELERADDIVRVDSGTLVQVEMWQLALKEAGIDSRVVGDQLSSSFGTAIPESVELWVHQADLDRARAVLDRANEERGGVTPPEATPAE